MFQNPSPAERAHLVMWGETSPSTTSNRKLLAVDRETVEILMEYIEQGQVDGSIRPDVDPNAAAFLLLGLGRGVAALMLNEAELTDVGALRAAYHDWIAAVLGTRTAKAPRSSARPKRRPMERRGGTRVSGEAHGGSGEPQNGAAPGSGPGTTSNPQMAKEAIWPERRPYDRRSAVSDRLVVISSDSMSAPTFTGTSRVLLEKRWHEEFDGWGQVWSP